MVLFLASPLIAQQRHGKPPLPPNGFWRRMANHHLKRITILRPTPDAQVQRPYRVLTWDDGSETLVFSRSFKMGKGQSLPQGESIAFEIDLPHGTYRTTLESAHEGKTKKPRSLEFSDSSGTGYSMSYGVETWEPARYVIPVDPLTRTLVNMDWSDCPNDTLVLNSASPSCWANSNTFVGTVWFMDACSGWSSTYKWGASASAAGNYHNDNFLLGLLGRTSVYAEADAYVEIGGFTSGAYIHLATGKVSGLLSGHEVWGVPMANYPNCPSGGGGGGGGGGSDGGGGGSGGGGWGCAPVYDGVSGDYLGDCCGYTAQDIVDCAMAYL
jgi:hypothetical protein